MELQQHLPPRLVEGTEGAETHTVPSAELGKHSGVNGINKDAHGHHDTEHSPGPH